MQGRSPREGMANADGTRGSGVRMQLVQQVGGQGKGGMDVAGAAAEPAVDASSRAGE